MKKLLWIILTWCFLLTACNPWNNDPKIDTHISTTEPILSTTKITPEELINTKIEERFICNDNTWTKLFFQYTPILTEIDETTGISSYIWSVTAKSFYIDLNWNLNETCSFLNVPIKIQITENENDELTITKYEDSFIGYSKAPLETFIWDKAYEIRDSQKIYDIKPNPTLLSKAEEYFWINVNETWNFNCEFCDITRCFTETIKNESIWWLSSLYSITEWEPEEWLSCFNFHSNWTLEKIGSRDAWKSYRHFWKDWSTIINEPTNRNQVLERFIIENISDKQIRFYTEYIDLM